jgi:hypothetical protein
MGIVKDLSALAALLLVNTVGFLSGLQALFGVLPIPHNWHDWGLTIGTALLYVWRRVRDNKRVKRHLVQVKKMVVPDEQAPPPARPARRAAKPVAEKHSTKMRKLAKP